MRRHAPRGRERREALERAWARVSMLDRGAADRAEPAAESLVEALERDGWSRRRAAPVGSGGRFGTCLDR